MTAPLYKPATKVQTSLIPYLALVTQADPRFEHDKHRQIEYEMQGHAFFADPYVRGAYNRLSNVYPVGQPRGALDPAIEAALAPTVGNPVPGLYEGTDNGAGWA